MMTESALDAVSHTLIVHDPLALVPRVTHSILIPTWGDRLLGLDQLASFQWLLV